MKRITVLPNWVLPDTIPSVYDTTSGTWIEMASKLYGAMRNLQMDYNSFAEEINKSITDFVNSVEQDQKCFKNHINKIMHDYIMKIDEKIKMQDLVIDNAKKYMQDNIISTSREVITQAVENGDISISSNYENEVLYLTITDNGGVE